MKTTSIILLAFFFSRTGESVDLGRLYSNGEGVPADKARATQLFQLKSETKAI